MTRLAGPTPTVGVHGAAVRLGVTRAVVIVALAWCALLVVSLWIEHATGRVLPTCVFKHVTGVPCPTCGSTRAVVQLLEGHPGAALALNPLMVLLLVGVPVWAAWRMLVPRSEGALARRSAWRRAIAWVGAFGLVGANWAYVIWHGN